ncbi:glycosyltransferase family 9 protein [Telmatospirillum sp.]|uniref:glycosyltransferase family 9 protein n=1 Tax=Telmatospirillum sp. TaxID=2079197 RepID=UPI00283D6D7E|nr:glycosyltransferase family 9 protein [Telmatospirillum sp.]MDR3435360.1 glycosyltransferase family 9 protein [Telmatospirillum sp.]
MSLPVLSPLFGWLVGDVKARTILVHGRDQPVGDGFLQAGFFHALRCRFPKSHITFAVSKGGSPYDGSLRAVMAPFIDEVLSDQGFCMEPRQLSPLASRPLGGRQFDLVIDLEKKFWRSLAVKRVRHRIFISASRHFLFSDRWPRQWKNPAHLSDQYMLLLDAIGMPKHLDLPAPDFHDSKCDDFARRLLPDGKVYVGLAPGAGDRGKCWPLDRYYALSRLLLSRNVQPVYLLGPQEKDWVQLVADAVPDALIPAWKDGRMLPEFTCPLQTVALGHRLAAAVTNDCGIAHMLAAAQTPLVTLFGYTNAIKYAPLTPHLKTITAQDYGSKSVSAIPLDAVVAALDDLHVPGIS